MSQEINIESGILKKARVAPFAILRVASLPVDALRSFVAPELSQALENYSQVRKRLRDTGKELVGSLEHLVRQANTCTLRNQLIELKRDIHNNRSVLLAKGTEEWLETTAARELMKNWQALQKQCETLLQSLTGEAEEAFDTIEAVLKRCWAVPAFRQGLSISSSSLCSRLSEDWLSFKQKKRRGITRSLFAYVSRTAAKTSPFSTLTSNCILQLQHFNGKSKLSAREVEIRAKSTLNRSIPAALKTALLARHANEIPTLFHLSPHIRFNGSRISGVGHRYQMRYGMLWLEQYPMALNLNPAVIEIFQKLPKSFQWSALEESLLELGVEPAEVNQTIKELLSRDVIRSHLAWRSDCDNPALLLVNALSHCSASVLTDFTKTVSAMDDISRSFSTMSCQERPEAIRRIHYLYTDLHQRLSPLTPPEIRTPIYENSWMSGIDFQAGSGFTNMFQRLGKAISGRICVSNAYLWLRDQFVEQYGPRGVCDDIPSFIGVAWSKLQAISLNQNNINHVFAVKTAEVGQDRFADIATENIAIPLTLFVQIIGNSLDELEGSKPRIVLNLAYNRIGWQSARWCDSSDESPGSLQKQIKIWLKDAFEPKIPVSTTISSESSTLQSHPRCTDRMLVVDGDPADEDFKLDDLRLKHNPDSNLLEMTTRDNLPIQTHYLGGALPLVSWGPRYLALLLGEPFELLRPPVDRVLNVNGAEVTHQARIEQDDCVLLRETWWVKSSELFRRLDKKSAVERLIAAQDFCDEFNIPRCVYAKGQITSWSLDSLMKVKKPNWMDFQNLACLDEILAMTKEVDWIILMEALPGPGEHVLKIKGHEHASEFMFEVVLSGAKK